MTWTVNKWRRTGNSWRSGIGVVFWWMKHICWRIERVIVANDYGMLLTWQSNVLCWQEHPYRMTYRYCFVLESLHCIEFTQGFQCNLMTCCNHLGWRHIKTGGHMLGLMYHSSEKEELFYWPSYCLYQGYLKICRGWCWWHSSIIVFCTMRYCLL